MVKPITEFDAERGSGKELAELASGKQPCGQEKGVARGQEASEEASVTNNRVSTKTRSKESAVEEEDKHVFKLPLSRSLARKVQQKAADEGVSPQELLCELVAEGLVLRAWEIMERKSAMRGGSGGRQQNFSQKNRFQQKGRRGFNRGNRAEKGNALLEDRAAFLEYVRNQEKGNK